MRPSLIPARVMSDADTDSRHAARRNRQPRSLRPVPTVTDPDPTVTRSNVVGVRRLTAEHSETAEHAQSLAVPQDTTNGVIALLYRQVCACVGVQPYPM